MTGDHNPSRTARVRRRMAGSVQLLAILAMLTSLLSGAFPTLVPVAAAAPGPSAAAVTFTVNDTSDALDATLGDGICAIGTTTCTLRAAIQEANFLAVVNPAETFTINLTAGAVYVLTLTGPRDDDALTGDLDIKANVVINGNGATVDGNTRALVESDQYDQQDRVFQVFSSAGDPAETPVVVEMNNLTVTNGYAYNGYSNNPNGYAYNANGGGILNDDFGGEFDPNGDFAQAAAVSSLTLQNVIVVRNSTGSDSEGLGGGIFNGEGRTLTIVGGSISANGLITTQSSYYGGTAVGGGIFNLGTLTVSGTTIQENFAGIGAGLFSSGSAALDGVAILQNSAILSYFGEDIVGGGGIFNAGGTLSLKSSRVIGNSAFAGGGILATPSFIFEGELPVRAAAITTTTVTDTEISSNSSFVFGGGIANYGEAPNEPEVRATAVSDTVFEVRGGVIANNISSGFSYSSYIGSGGAGGGIGNLYATMNVQGTLITNNSVAAYGTGEFRFGSGGGVFNLGAMTIDRSALVGNFVSGAGSGGGIANGYLMRYFLSGLRANGARATDLDTNLTVLNSTLSGNSAPSGGAALYNVDNSTATLNNATVAGNQSGVLNDPTVNLPFNDVRAQAATINIQNSIIASNTDYNCSGTIANAGYNIDSATSCGFNSTANSLSNTDPKLGPLAVNAPGKTPTYALLAGSPALERVPTANCPPAVAPDTNSQDQRGVARPQGTGCDVGAYETEIGSFSVTLSTSGPGSLSVAPGTYNYPAGSTPSFSATPNANNVAFIGWTVDGTFVGFGNPLDLPVTKTRTVVATFAAIPAFCDVVPSTPGAVAIGQLAARGVIFGSDNPNGPGKCFLPGDTLLRIHVAGMVARAYGWDKEDHGNSFTDKGSVDNDLWRNAGTLAFYNVALGYRDGSYDPTGPVLHAQAVSFVTRAMIRKGYWTLQEDNAAYYTGVPTASGHRQDAVTYHFYAGNILGTNDPTDPWNGPTGYDQPSTRTYFAQVLWQAYSSYFSTNHIP